MRVAGARLRHRIVEVRLTPDPLIINRHNQVAAIALGGLFDEMVSQQLQRAEKRARGFRGGEHTAFVSGSLDAGPFGGTIFVDAGHLEAMLFGALEAVVRILDLNAEAARAVADVPTAIRVRSCSPGLKSRLIDAVSSPGRNSRLPGISSLLPAGGRIPV